MIFDEADEKRKHHVLIIFDVTNDKRRRTLTKALKSFGTRIQKSAFECILDVYQYDRLVARLKKTINKEEDVLKIYRFTDRVETITIGNMKEVEDEKFEII